MTRLGLLLAFVAVSVLACSDNVTPPDATVASVSVTVERGTLLVGQTTLATALLRDASGNTLSNRPVSWNTSNSTVASVSQDGTVTAAAVGGPVTITATSEGRTGNASITVAPGVATGIQNIRTFLERCPTNDPVAAQIRQDFELRADGQLISSPIVCAEPFNMIPIAQLTDELIALQVLRTTYYMSVGTQGRLPWTTQSLYGWMASAIRGVNLKTAPGQLYCCDVINGGLYISTSRQDAAQREGFRDWKGISIRLDFYAHEIRHAGQGGPGHVNGCPAFPFPTDPAGCDAAYNLSNLGSYGVQYWLQSSWATGFLNIGIGCQTAAIAVDYAKFNETAANSFRSRFVSNAPPMVTASQPYGGPCQSP